MKKLLLGLGTLSLAILPVAAMVSCSSTAPTLDTEAAKFAKPVPTTDKALTTEKAVASINSVNGEADKKTALAKFVVIPTLESGFTLAVKSAAVDSAIDTQVNVTITITETAATANKTKDVKLMVSGLVATPATLETEAAKFETTVVTTKPLLEISEAAGSIKPGETADQRLVALKVFADLPTLNKDFTFTVDSAAANTTTPSQLDITVTVTDTKTTATEKTKVATFKVSGLALSTLDKQKALFTTTAKKGDSTADAALLTITSAEGAAAKLAALEAISTDAMPTLAKGFTFEVKSGVVNTEKTTITVTITITQESAPANANTIEATLTVTGFTAAASK